MTTPNLAPVAQLVADLSVHLIVGSDPTTQAARAQVLVNIAGAFIASNDGDLVTASADFASITADITDPALKDAALTALTVVSNYATGISKLNSATVLGVGLTTFLSAVWTAVSSVASKYVTAAPAVTNIRQALAPSA